MEENEIEEAEPNRNRSRQVKFWVSEEEYQLLQKKMEAAGGVNQGAYIRKMILDGYIVNLDIPELKEIIRLLSITSNNVNQMARKVNAGSSIYKEDVEEINTKLEQVPMIVTTNLTIDELTEPADLARGRIYSRVLERCLPIRVSDQNIRDLNQAAVFDRATQLLGGA